MGKLAIKKIIYKGDQYHYSSPDLESGLQIIEASNGAGKTTFSSFITYGLGMYVKQFDFKNKEENHNEIYNDTNNYVLLKVIINENQYEFKRFFSPKTNNVIFVKGEDGFEDIFPINRNSLTSENDWTFSDWLLAKLGIEVCEIYQGTRKFKINFSDLFRLIHYDQDTNAKKIYKEHRIDNNFIADSTAVRKVIFELLVGYQFSEYYALIGEYNKVEREKNTYKATLDNYVEMVNKMGVRLSELNKDDLLKSLNERKIQLHKLQLYKESLLSKGYSTTQFDSYIQQLRQQLFKIDSQYSELKSLKKTTTVELRDLLKLKDDVILEVTQIKKIILAHEELNIFSPNTCPCCLRKVKRKRNYCICGNSIDENQYEKFFYNSEEYLDILKSKQKSVETIDIAIQSCREELNDLDTDLAKLDIERTKLRQELSNIEQNINKMSNDNEVNAVNDKILDIKEEIKDLEQKLTILEQYINLEKEFTKSKDTLVQLNTRIREMEVNVKTLIQTQLKEFNKIYTELLMETDKNVKTVELDENYMPLINDGEYRQASSYVPRRFLYFITLLKMSIDRDNVPFPKFLLIDTPESLGIDEDNLKKCMALIEKLFDKKNEFQIILTTGIDKYPKQFKKYVVETLTENNKLLKKVKKE
ncbi:coiled-coil domain-containing protein [Thermaerobacillus caldiproteolyticus]|uniref:hypothetical protein n=1 Tax=Thermaerobacillus caldiproteolyticus TaxID=247480 RepID=UPI0018F19CDE|nr:hypothetical protein [Anoxybacillus caldiproteolyticus]